MIFPRFPKRSSSDDDALDHALNTWAVGDCHSERREESRLSEIPQRGSLVTDALEYHRWADDTRRSDPAASGPAAETWNRILRSTAQTQSRGGDMSSVAMSSSPQAAIVYDSRPYNRGQIGRYFNYAASLLIVFGVAFAGAFMAMQINQPGGSNGQFALFSQTDESATCDVEPMTVDEVMEIVENPYHYMDESEFPNPIGSTTHETPWEDEYQEVQPRLPVSLNVGLDTEPTTTAFDQASEVIAEYVACLQTDGSVAMMLRFADPFSIQHHIRMEFPFYRTEDQVRPYVSEWIASGTIYHELSYERQGETLTYIPANDKEMAGTQIHDFGLGFDQVIYVGSEIYDENGEFIGNFHPTLYMTYDVDEEYLDHGVVFTLLHSRYTGEWYVVTEDWMQLNSVI